MCLTMNMMFIGLFRSEIPFKTPNLRAVYVRTSVFIVKIKNVFQFIIYELGLLVLANIHERK